jgi:hypothetical protein
VLGAARIDAFLGRKFLHEHLSRVQPIGMAVIIVGVSIRR